MKGGWSISIEEHESIIEGVRNEVARKHRVTGVSSSLEAELPITESFPPPEVAEKIISKEYAGEQQPSGSIPKRPDNVD